MTVRWKLKQFGKACCINHWALCFEAGVGMQLLVSWAPPSACVPGDRSAVILKIISTFFCLFFFYPSRQSKWFCPATGNIFLLQHKARGNHSLYLSVWGKHGIKATTCHFKKREHNRNNCLKENKTKVPLSVSKLWVFSKNSKNHPIFRSNQQVMLYHKSLQFLQYFQ